MSRLQVTYDIPLGAFSELTSKIKDHLTPEPGKHASIATSCELEKVRAVLDKITGELNPQGHRIKQIPLDYASDFAIDLGIFDLQIPDNTEEYWRLRDELQHSRYLIPCQPGTTRSYTIDLFGKHVSGYGDAPMTVVLDADTGSFGESLYLLTSWYEELKKNFTAFSAQTAIMTEKSSADGAGYGRFFKTLPKTKEEFEAMIEKEKNRLAAVDWVSAINMTRFYFDFFGKPIQDAGYNPTSVQAAGDLQFSKSDLEVMLKFPSLGIEAIMAKIIPWPTSGMLN